MNNHTKHVQAHVASLKDESVRTELCLVLYKLGIKSAKPTSLNLNTLNSLFKQVYATGINDIVLGTQPSLFGIDPISYDKWKSGK